LVLTLMNKTINRLLLALSAICLLTLAWLVARPVGSALQIGGDENCEVTKGLLCVRGFALYREIWSDQPPLLTYVLALAFKAFGTNIAVARLVAVSFGMSLLAGLAFLASRRLDGFAAFVAAFCLVTAPQVLELSVSPMQEVPAISAALWAFWPLWRWQKGGRWPWLVASGAFLATAMQIKFTAAVVAPALAVELLLQRPDVPGLRGLAQRFAAVGIWSASVAVGFAGLVVAFGTVPLKVLWAAHFSSEMLARAGDTGSPDFVRMLWYEHSEAVYGAGAALFVAVLRRDGHRVLFPAVWLLTATIIHLHHRPWWPFYYLHFAVPLAWLSGYGVAGVLRLGCERILDRPRTLSSAAKSYGGLAAAFLLWVVLVRCGVERIAFRVTDFWNLPLASEDPIVPKLQEHASKTHWIYTRSSIHAFHANLPIVPELAVLPAKRFWSDQITDERIWSPFAVTDRSSFC
jgi:4-amino-4-deoxy-L-arabinose transferase-like glycosyltransferase